MFRQSLSKYLRRGFQRFCRLVVGSDQPRFDYRRIFDRAGDGLIIINPETRRIEEANAAMAEMAGYERSDLIGKPFTIFLLEDGPYASERVEGVIEEVLEEGMRRLEWKVLRKERSFFWAEVTVRAVELGPGTRIVAFCRDVTRRKEAEKGNRFQARLLEAVGEAVIATRPDGTIIYWNGGAEELYGWEADEVIGDPITEVTPALGTEGRAEEIMDRLRAGRSWSGEFSVRTRTGERKHAKVHNRPMRSEEGELEAIIGVSTDISDLKRAEREARHREREFRTLLERSPDVIMRFDREHRHVYVNSAIERYSDRDPKFFLGRRPDEVGYREDLAEAWCSALDHVFATGEEEEMSFDIHWNGERRHFHTFMIPERRQGEGVDSVLTVSRDLTRQQSNTERLEELSRQLVDLQEEERRRIALELHDEIGQTLTALSMALDIEAAPLAPEDRGRLGEARSMVDDLAERVRTLTLDLRPSQLDDLGLVPALYAFFKRYEQTTGVEVAFHHGGVESAVLGGRIRTSAYRIVQESLTNVARHANADRAHVNVWVEDEHLEIRVRDEGSGFDPSSVVGDLGTRGLSGMRERVALLGGHVEIDSAPGKGTRISVRFPLADSTNEIGARR